MLLTYAGAGTMIVIDDWPTRGMPLHPFWEFDSLGWPGRINQSFGSPSDR